jgi:hypothetical protein
MPKPSPMVHILPFPFDAELFDARLRTIEVVPGPTSTDVLFTFDSFQPQSAPEVCDLDGHPAEHLSGIYVPMQLRFINAAWLRKTGIYEEFDTLPEDHSARQIFGIQRSCRPAIGEYFWVVTGTYEPGELSVQAESCQLESVPGAASRPIELCRRWASVPAPLPARIPHRPALYRRYGGDPITFRLGRRTYARRLFIGGLFHQQEERPTVHHVLNLCGIENPWFSRSGESQQDRRVERGEMAAGMDAMDIFQEAAWVTERLRAGRRVLVHCYAGINRSSTVCCAALMFLEGLSPEEALARVRQYHPLAWPDPYHWFTLRWMSQALAVVESPAGAPPDPAGTDGAQEASLLRVETNIG